MPSVIDLTAAAEVEWLDRWSSGPIEGEPTALPTGASAPDLVLPDHTGASRSLSEFWSPGPALVMFWRHFGSGCGAERATRLVDEYAMLREAGLEPVIIAQGEPARSGLPRPAQPAVPGPV